MIKTTNATVSKALKRLHYQLDIMLTCLRWYVAYPLSLRHLEEMMSERAVSVDHSTGTGGLSSCCLRSVRHSDRARKRSVEVGEWMRPTVRPANVARPHGVEVA
jgi:transposase-like protein